MCRLKTRKVHNIHNASSQIIPHFSWMTTFSWQKTPWKTKHQILPQCWRIWWKNMQFFMSYYIQLHANGTVVTIVLSKNHWGGEQSQKETGWSMRKSTSSLYKADEPSNIQCPLFIFSPTSVHKGMWGVVQLSRGYLLSSFMAELLRVLVAVDCREWRRFFRYRNNA